MKGFHPNPQRDGYNLAGLHWIVAMIKYRRQIVAYTFRKYTRYHIRQLFSNQLNDNNLFLSIKHVALPTGFGCRILNLGNSKSYFVKYLFALKSLSISIGGETMTAQITFPFLQQPPPPPLSILELKQIGFMYCPTACTYSFELVRGKQGVYISGQSAKGNYLPQNSNIHVLPLGSCTTQMLCLVLEIKL